MFFRNNTFLILCCLFSSSKSFSQCAVGESEVFIEVVTDNWGYECYWELVPSGNGCGNATIFSGGNTTELSCVNTGASAGNGYANSSTNMEGPFCVTTGTILDIMHIDDFGDGGSVFNVYVDGLLLNTFTGTGNGNTFTFTADTSGIIVNNNICNAISLPVNGSVNIYSNNGADVETGEVAPPADGCASLEGWCNNNLDATVWFTFVATATGSVDITLCNSATNFDTQLAVYSGDGCASFNNLTLVAANDDQIGGCSNGNGFSSGLQAYCLNPGETYYIQVDAYNGTGGDFGISISELPAGTFTYTSSVENIDCFGNSDLENASIEITPSNGTPSITWVGPNGFSATTYLIDNLAVGSYEMTLENPCGAPIVESFVITEPSPISTAVTKANLDCSTEILGSADVAVQGGTPNYTFEWTGPNGYSNSNTQINNLLAGTYSLSITDANNCNYVEVVDIDFENEIDFNIGNDTTVCVEESLLYFAPVNNSYLWQDGSINQFYSWTPTLSEIGQNIISVEIENNIGCIGNDSISVNVIDCSTSSLSENEEISINLFPNPVDNKLTLSGDLKGDYNLKIISISGEHIRELIVVSNNKSIDLNLVDLQKGFYFLLINGENQNVKKSFVKH